jgi:hypothetical protein
MQATVSSAGEADSYALLLMLKHSADNGRLVRHFVCSECLGMVEAVQGLDYLHDCEGGHYAGEGALSARAASAAIDADLAALA